MSTVSALKRVEVSPEIQQDPRLSAAVERATDLLDEILGGLAAQVEARWARSADPSSVLVLSLSYEAESAASHLTEEDLEDNSRLWYQLDALWRRVLRVRSQRLLRELRQIVDNLDGE